MRSKLPVILLTIGSAGLIGTASPTSPATSEVEAYRVQLTGQAEVASLPGWSGDSDGSGLVELTVDPAGKRICYDFKTSGLATPLMAHIHRARAQEIGPSVVTLFTGSGGDLDDCLLWTEKRLAEIVDDPSNFYVNFYTTEFPDGALRGQLAG